MKFGSIDKVLLFGGSPQLVATADHLRTMGLAYRIYTAPRHAAEALDETRVTLAQALERAGHAFVVTDDINTEPTVRAEVTPTTLGLGLGEAWSFDADLIALFGGKLLDFMGIPLPRYRGGAHYTWMILRGDREGASNLQVINTDMVQGEVDTGEIVKTSRYRYPDSARVPMDYFRAAVALEVAFLKDFLAEVESGHEFDPKKPDESQSLFLPRLNTMLHGWIDWSLDGEEIERFVCAFDEPYVGASTRLNTSGVRVHLKGVRLDRTEAPFHPFQSGLVTRVTSEGTFVATRSGHLVVRSILPSAGETLTAPPRPGDRLFTPSADLESALGVRVRYGSH